MRTQNINRILSVATFMWQHIATKIGFYTWLFIALFTLFSRCSLNPHVDENEQLKTLPRASAPGDVVGKVSVGYQGWFAAIGDGSPINAWWHWTQNWSQSPSPSNNGIKS